MQIRREMVRCSADGRVITQSIAILAFCASVAASGQSSSPSQSDVDLTNLSLKELMEIPIDTVYSASRHTQTSAQAPSSVTVVRSDEIKRYGHRTLADILRTVRGVNVTYDRNYSFLGIRGFNRPGDYNTRVLLLVNGHRLNDNVFDAAAIGGEFPIDVDLIERVEVIRGPGSSLYGNNAFFGVINVITKDGTRLNGGEVSAEYGSFDAYKGRFTYGRQVSDVRFMFSGSYFDMVGPERLYFQEFDDPTTNNGIVERVDYERGKSFFGSVSWKDFTLSGTFAEREKGIPTASFGTVFGDPRAQTVDETSFVDLTFRHDFENAVEVMARVAYDRYDYTGDYPYDYANPGDPPFVVLNHDGSRGEWWSTELQVSRMVADRHRLTLGADYRDQFRQEMFNFDIDPRLQYMDSRRSTYNAAIYGQAEIAVRTNLLLNLGVRYDYYESFGESVNPRLALIYEPVSGSTVKLLYGTAFRAPNNYEAFYEALTSYSNPNLRAEEIATYELVFEQQLAPHTTVSVAGYYYEIDGLISQQVEPGPDPVDPADDILIYRNVESLEAKGIEFGMQMRHPNGVLARVSYALQHAEVVGTGDALTSSPEHLARANLSVPFWSDKIFGGIELQYSSSARTLAGSRAGDFLVANVTLFTAELLKGLDVSATVYNIFDSGYGYPGAGEHRQDILRQDGRAFRLKATYRF